MSLEKSNGSSIDGQWIIDNEANEKFVGPSSNGLNVGNQMNEEAKQIEELLKQIDVPSSLSEYSGNNSIYDDSLNGDIEYLMNNLDSLFDNSVTSSQSDNNNELSNKITSIEKELVEIEKKLNTIYLESLGSHFTTLVSEQYPKMYADFINYQTKYKKSMSDQNYSDISDKYRKLLDKLEIAKEKLRVYELFYSKFKEVQKEYIKQQTKTNSNDLNTKISGSKNEIISSNAEKIIGGLLQQFPDITSIDPNNPNCLRTVDGKYYLNVTNNYMATLGIPISKEEFITLVDYFEIHPERIRIKDFKVSKQQETKIEESQEDLIMKKQVINEIIIAMMNNGEFPKPNMDVDKRMLDMRVAEEQLKKKSIEELETILSVYNNAGEKINSSGLKK